MYLQLQLKIDSSSWLLGIHASNSDILAVSNLPGKLINILGIFRQRFLSCKIESYLSYFQYKKYGYF